MGLGFGWGVGFNFEGLGIHVCNMGDSVNV